jgi:nucleoid-associated protein YgaU
MGLLSFIKDAGEKLFGIGKAEAAKPEAPVIAAQSILDYIKGQGIATEGLNVAFDPATAAVTVDGTVADQATKEKILLCCGNVAGVASVNDLLVVSTPAPEAQYHTVVSGDNLSKIAKKFYGNANKYPVIFEANKPMLKHPDKIYPGQMLRIPPL